MRSLLTCAVIVQFSAISSMSLGVVSLWRAYSSISMSSPPTCAQLVISPVHIPRSCSRVRLSTGLLSCVYITSASSATSVTCASSGGAE